MTSSGIRLAMLSVRAWTHVYTCGLAPDVKDARRAEIDSDLWESCHDRDRAGRSDFAFQILARLLLGIPDDVMWRAAFGMPRRFMRVAGLAATAAIVIVAVWVFDVLQAEELPQPPALVRMIKFLPPPPPPPPPSPPREIRGRR